VFGLGVVATTALASLPSLGGHTLLFGLANLAAPAAVNAALFLIAFRVLTPRQVPTGQLVLGAVVAGVLFTGLQAAGGYLVGHNLKHAQQVYGFFAIVLGLMSWLYLSAEVVLYGAELNVVRARRLWPRSLLQPPLTEADQRALVQLAKHRVGGPWQPAVERRGRDLAALHAGRAVIRPRHRQVVLSPRCSDIGADPLSCRCPTGA
jgi:hypothetical protein